jgi:hypothetical protein
MDKVVKEFENEGVARGLTFRQAAGVVAMATGNNLLVNPFDERSITRCALQFDDDNSGHYPQIEPREGGGFDYITISGRRISIYPIFSPRGENKWILDCSEWWESSVNFRRTLIECLKKVLSDPSFSDESLPEPEEPHTHVGNEVCGQTFHLYNIPVNNHGCSGFNVYIKATSPTEGEVIDGYSCQSCWQVGHDSSESPIPIGFRVRVPEGYCWVCASEEDIQFRSSRDVSRNGRTVVAPSDLIIEENTA